MQSLIHPKADLKLLLLRMTLTPDLPITRCVWSTACSIRQLRIGALVQSF